MVMMGDAAGRDASRRRPRRHRRRRRRRMAADATDVIGRRRRRRVRVRVRVVVRAVRRAVVAMGMAGLDRVHPPLESEAVTAAAAAVAVAAVAAAAAVAGAHGRAVLGAAAARPVTPHPRSLDRHHATPPLRELHAGLQTNVEIVKSAYNCSFKEVVVRSQRKILKVQNYK